jgi:hypothetical protein
LPKHPEKAFVKTHRNFVWLWKSSELFRFKLR